MNTYQITDEVKRRFWAKVIISSPNQCWQWTACKNAGGYGVFGIKWRPYLAHRISYEITFGSFPRELKVLHECDNPACVNPSHLFIGTQLDNIRDRHQKGRSRGGCLRGEERPHNKITTAIVLEIRQLARDGVGPCEIARRFDISQCHASRIIQYQRWRHVP